MKKCKICECTDDNCTSCVEKTGIPCYWFSDNICSACAFPEDEIKTSEEWQKHVSILILDPDGWDRKNFQYSWYEEQISFSEFNKRMIQSTCRWETTSPSDYPGTDFLGLPAEH